MILARNHPRIGADLSAIFEAVRVVDVRYDCFGGHSADAVDSLHTANLVVSLGDLIELLFDCLKVCL